MMDTPVQPNAHGYEIRYLSGSGRRGLPHHSPLSSAFPISRFNHSTIHGAQAINGGVIC
jgi:hypothetical protein